MSIWTEAGHQIGQKKHELKVDYVIRLNSNDLLSVPICFDALGVVHPSYVVLLLFRNLFQILRVAQLKEEMSNRDKLKIVA